MTNGQQSNATAHPAGKSRRIVVGVDGSSASQAALRWAIAHSDGQVTPVAAYVWRFPPKFGVGEASAPMNPIGQHDKAEAHARESLERAVREAFTGDPPEVELVTVDSAHPGSALIELARDASMLVLGSHHHHVLDMTVGSTIRGCLHHASCPVVVVPAE